MTKPQTTEFPATLTEALDKIPPSYEVAVRREANDGGWWMIAKRKQNGGELSIHSGTFPLWQQAWTELWGKL